MLTPNDSSFFVSPCGSALVAVNPPAKSRMWTVCSETCTQASVLGIVHENCGVSLGFLSAA